MKLFDNVLNQAPIDGRIFVLTGQNGSGKTRALEKIALQMLDTIAEQLGPIRRLICLSGTVLDKFPRFSVDTDNYIYFGRKTNSNMFSEIAPYRRLAEFLMTPSADWENRSAIAKEMLASISLGRVVCIHFRRGRNTKDKHGINDLDINVTLGEKLTNQNMLQERLNQLRQGIVHVSGVSLTKNGKELNIVDLSSGERSYALAVLALAFSVVNGAVVLFDEPENSLHPKWQASIIKDMWKIISSVAENTKIFIATHSPLIVSGAANGQTYIFDLENNTEWMHSKLYGNTSDSILKSQFGLLSPRSVSFLYLMQKCLKTMVTIQSNSAEFKIAADELLEARVSLDQEDPLYNAIKDIEEARRALG